MKPFFTSSSFSKKPPYSILALVFWLGVWQAAYWAVGKDYLLASPFEAFSRLISLAGEAVFRRSVAATCCRVLAGFSLAFVFGGFLAFLSSRFFMVQAFLSPLLRVIRATPVASFIILALVWLPTGHIPILIAFVMVLPLAYSNLAEGIAALDRPLLEMARLFRFSRARTIRLIYLPELMPYITAACTTGIGFAWKSVIATEIIAHPALSIGRQIHNSRVYFEIPDLFAWTAAVILISVAIERGVIALLRILKRRLLNLNKRKGGIRP